MDFVVGLLKTKSNHDAIWVVIDRLTKSAHLLPINQRFSLEKLVKLYLDEIVMRHRVLVSIMSDRLYLSCLIEIQGLTRDFGDNSIIIWELS